MSILFEFIGDPDCVDALSLLWRQLIFVAFPLYYLQQTLLEDNLCSHVYRSFFQYCSRFLRFSGESELEKLEKVMHDSIIEIIKTRETKAMNEKEEEDRFGRDFLGLLLKAHHDTNSNQRISVDDVVDECKTFYLAGHESTASFLAWTVFLLAHHTDWQEEARKEVLQLFGKQTPNPDGIAKLKTVS